MVRDEPLIIVGGCRARILHLLFFPRLRGTCFFFPRQQGTCFFFPRVQGTCFFIFSVTLGTMVFFFFWQPCDHFFRDAPNKFFFQIGPCPPPKMINGRPLSLGQNSHPNRSTKCICRRYRKYYLFH